MKQNYLMILKTLTPALEGDSALLLLLLLFRAQERQTRSCLSFPTKLKINK